MSGILAFLRGLHLKARLLFLINCLFDTVNCREQSEQTLTKRPRSFTQLF